MSLHRTGLTISCVSRITVLYLLSCLYCLDISIVTLPSTSHIWYHNFNPPDQIPSRLPFWLISFMSLCTVGRSPALVVVIPLLIPNSGLWSSTILLVPLTVVFVPGSDIARSAAVIGFLVFVAPARLDFSFEMQYRMSVYWFLDPFVLDMSICQH